MPARRADNSVAISPPLDYAVTSRVLLWSNLRLGTTYRARLAEDATKPHMARRCVDRLRMARCRAIAAAVIRCAEVRAALQDSARDSDVRLARVEALILLPTARVSRNAACLICIRLMSSGVPVARPLPDIADHVADTVAVRRECHHRGGARETVFAKIFVRKVALPGIGEMFAVGREFVTPGEFGLRESAA